MAQANPWSQMKNSSAAPTDEEVLQQLINAGALPKAPGVPKPIVPTINAVKAAVKKSAPPPVQAPVQQEQPGGPQGSPGTFRLPFQDQLTEDQQKEIALKQRAYFLDPQEMASRYAGLEGMPAIQDLKKGNQDYKDLIAMQAAQGGQTDLSGLMGLADVASDNKFGLRAGYKVPGEKAKELLANIDKAQDNQRDLTKEIIALSNSGKAGMDTSTIQSLLLNKIAEGFKTAPPPRPSGGGNPTANYHKWATRTDSALKKSDEGSDAIQALRAMVESGNPIDVSRVPIIRASFDAHGRPNQQEIIREGGNPALLERADAALTRLASGGMTPANKQLYLDSINTAAQYHGISRKIMMDRLKEEGKNYQGVTPEMTDRRFPKTERVRAGEGAAPAAPKNAREQELKSLQDSNAEIMKFIQSQKGGQ